VLAIEAMESLRKRWKELAGEVRDGLWCARYDSRPLEYANEPIGRAESESRRRAWREVRDVLNFLSCVLFLLYDSRERLAYVFFVSFFLFRAISLQAHL
jgi:hypothetical protein